MKKIALLTLVSSALLGLLVACGGSSDSSGSSSCTGPSAMSSVSPACSSCIQSACGSKLSAFCSKGCTASSSSSACDSAVTDVENCIVDSCLSQCESSGSGGAGPSDGSGGKSGSGSGSGGKSGTGTAESACYIEAESTCTATVVPTSDKTTFDGQCTQSGGVAGDHCPSTDLIGCCTFGGGAAPVSSKVCSYKAGSGFDEASCTSASGSWSTSP